MNNTSIAPRFRLLVHGQDGSIPYLTPELLRLIFYPETEETNDQKIVEDGKLHREHMILGLAVKDTCITPDYQETKTRKKKRKGNTSVEDGNTKLFLQKLNDTSAVDTSLRNASSDKDSDHTREKQQQQQQQDSNKKPIGYSFLDKTKSSRICDLLLDGAQDESTSTSTYLEKYLCTPPKISTLIVPTFSFVDGQHETTATCSDAKKYIPKKQEANQSQPKKCSGSNVVIPKSTKNAVSIETPHGWQSIRPEQYSETVSSLLLSDSKIVQGNCEGIVGLFDHIELTSAQSDSLFSENVTNNDDGGSCIERVQVKKQAQRKITASLQKSNDWACRVHQTLIDEEEQPNKFWLPVQLLASQLPSHVVFTTPNIRPNIEKKIECKEQQFLSSHPNVAIIGWEALVCGSNQRRNVLRSLMSTLQSKSTIPKEFLLLAVNDVQSILDAAREGVSIIGSDIARLRSRDGIALCFDFESENGISAKEMDLKDTRFARDFTPLLYNCTSLACRPRKNGAPSFTRAYIHHLIKAKEMLAEILLFAHNLHQLILLFRQLSKAAVLDDESEKKENLETLCRDIELSLASVKTAP